MKPLLFLLLAIAAALAVPAVVDASHLNTVILVLMAAQLGVSWNLVGGYAGQVSLGHAAFYGLGAYTSTVLLINFGLNPWLGVLAGGVVAVLLSLVAFALIAGLSGSVFSNLGKPIWWIQPWSFHILNFVYDITSWALAALVLAHFVRRR